MNQGGSTTYDSDSDTGGATATLRVRTRNQSTQCSRVAGIRGGTVIYPSCFYRAGHAPAENSARLPAQCSGSARHQGKESAHAQTEDGTTLELDGGVHHLRLTGGPGRCSRVQLSGRDCLLHLELAFMAADVALQDASIVAQLHGSHVVVRNRKCFAIWRCSSGSSLQHWDTSVAGSALCIRDGSTAFEFGGRGGMRQSEAD